MYDDSAVHVMRGHHQGHWYDEPPYESDPDDFLMTGIHRHGPAAMIQVKHIIPKYIKKNPFFAILQEDGIKIHIFASHTGYIMYYTHI
jgi:hypothetical protein